MATTITTEDGITAEYEHPTGNGNSRNPTAEVAPYDPRLRDLAAQWGDVTPEDLTAIGPSGLIGRGHSAAKIVRIGKAAFALTDGAGWTAADCVVVLHDDHKKDYAVIARWLGISEDRAEKTARIGRAFPKSERHTNLSLAHHEEVCALTPAARETILAKAETEGLSKNDVRAEVRAAKPGNARNTQGRRSSADGTDQDTQEGRSQPRTDDHAPFDGLRPDPSIVSQINARAIVINGDVKDRLFAITNDQVSAERLALVLLADCIESGLAESKWGEIR